MAEEKNSERPRNPKKVFLGALKGDVKEAMLRLAMEPAAKDEAIVSIVIVTDKNPDYAGGSIAFVECKDEATAAGIIALLKGTKVPEIAQGEIEAALAFARECEGESTAKPQLTRDEVDEIAAALSGNPRFAEKCRGKKGESGKDGAPGQKGDPGTKGPAGANGAVGPKGADGAKGPHGPAGQLGPEGLRGPQGRDAPQWPNWVIVACVLAALVVVLGHAFCGSSGRGPQGERGLPGNPGIDGKAGAPGESTPSPTAAEVAGIIRGDAAFRAEVAATLKADQDFLKAVTPVAPAPEAEPEVAPPAPEPPPAAPAADEGHRGPRVVSDRFDNVERKFHAIDERLDSLEAARR